MTRASRKDIKPFLEALDKGEVDTFVVSWSNPDGNRKTGNSRSCMTGSLPIMVRLLGVCLDNIKYTLVWNKFLNALYQVDKPISLASSNKIALLIVIVCMLLVGALQNFQATSNVF